MTTPDQDRLRSIFDAAAELPPEHRPAFLHDACNGDTALESEVAALLQSLDTRWSTDLDTAVVELSSSALSPSAPSASLPATSIAGFRLLRIIGRGAMGVVCEAEQEHPKRLVALKILSAWNAGRELRRRFVAEAEILARLDHPGIARVIAAGTHDMGVHPGADQLHDLLGSSPTVPWLAMELVEGARPLTAYALDHHLDWRAKIDLLAQVCDAVHSGHVMGVIHRDLKPANILVNSAGKPKVIDYGVARTLAADPQHTLHATIASGAPFVGTLAYMSPEQVDGRAQLADVRSDVYALAVILYELLTGSSPYTLDPTSFSSSARIITTSTPKRPRALIPNLDPDLDIILSKALEKDPDARYQSAADFADDLRRVLSSRPIRAHRPSTLYTLRKWVRRHPARAALASLTAAAILFGIVGISLGLAREAAARALADRQGRLANLRAADFALRLGDAATAKSCLAAIPPHLRAWEWSYLSAQTDTSQHSLDLRPLSTSSALAQLTPNRDIVLFLDDSTVTAVNTSTRSVLWSTPCAPSRSNVHYSADATTALVPGINESTVLDLRTGAIQARLKHPSPALAYAGALDPSANLAAAAGQRFVALFDAHSGALLHSWPVNAWVYGVAFDSRAHRLAWSGPNAITIADTASGAQLTHLPTSRKTIWEPSFLRWSPDDRLLISSSDSDIEIFDLTAPPSTPPRRLSSGSQRIISIDTSADSRFILAASKDSTIRIWDSASGELLRTLVGHEHPVHMVAAHPDPHAPSDSALLVQSVDSSSRLRDWIVRPDHDQTSFSTTVGPDGGFVASLAFSPVHNRIVSGTYGGSIEFHPPSPALKRPADQPTFTLISVATSTSGLRALGLSFTGVLHAVDLSSNSVLWHRTLDLPHDACAVSNDASLGAVGSCAGILSIINMSDASVLRTLTCRNVQISRLRFTSDNKSIVIAFLDGSLELWNLASSSHTRTILPPTPGSLATFALSSDDRWIAYAISGDSGEIRLEHLASAAHQRTFPPLRTFIWSLAFSPDTSRLAVGSQDRQTRILEVPSGEELLRFQDHQGSVMSLAWSPDAQTLLSGAYDRKIFIHRASQPR